MEENGPSAFVKPLVPTPDTLASAPRYALLSPLQINRLLFTELIKRLRILTVTLLPFEVHPDVINDPTSRVITPSVVSAYTKAAGDLVEAVCISSLRMCLHSKPCQLHRQLPYCLLRARRDFMAQANRDVADYGENRGRGKLAL
jgi:hypothetical protein